MKKLLKNGEKCSITVLHDGQENYNKAVEINKVCRDGKRFAYLAQRSERAYPWYVSDKQPDRMNRKLECILYLFPLPKII